MPAGIERSEKVEFANRAGEMLAGSLELPAAAPVGHALFAHCFTCSQDSIAASRISRALRGRGIAVLRFDFTGLGGSQGDFANTTFSSNVDDLVAAADYLRRERQAAPALLVGHSLGGAAVLVAGARIPETAAVATIAAPADLEQLRRLLADDLAEARHRGRATVEIGGRRFTLKREFLDDLERTRLAEHVRALEKAVLIMHAPADRVVDIDHARRLFDAAVHPKSILALDGADHLLSRRADAEYAAAMLAAWSSRYLGR